MNIQDMDKGNGQRYLQNQQEDLETYMKQGMGKKTLLGVDVMHFILILVLGLYYILSS